MKLIRRSLLTLTFAVSLVAQGTTAPTEGPILVLKSAEARFTRGLAMELGLLNDPRPLTAGEHYVLTLDASRRPSLGIGQGEVALFEVWLRPPALLEAFDDSVKNARMIVQAAGGMALVAQGFDPKAARQLMDTIFDFPKQVSEATLAADGDPWTAGARGELSLEIGLVPVPDSPFAKIVSSLRPNEVGAPVSVREGALGTVRFSLAPEAMRPLVRQLTSWSTRLVVRDPKERVTVMKVTDRALALYDGTGILSFGADLSMEGFMGTADSGAFVELFESEEYRAAMVAQQTWNRFLDVEIEPAALEYRGVALLRTTVFNDGPDNPMMPGGKMVTLTGAVGDQIILCSTEERARHLVDLVEGGGLKRGPLPGGAVATMDFALSTFVEKMSGQQLPSDSPSRMALTVVPDEGRLRIRMCLE